MYQFNAIAFMLICLQVLGFTGASYAATESRKQSCAEFQWNSAFLKAYPIGPASCRDVIVKDGVKYAQFHGAVCRVHQHNLQVTIYDAGELPASKIAFQIGLERRVTLGSEAIKLTDLRVGDVVTFWIREGEFGISPNLTDSPIAVLPPLPMP